MSLGLDQYIFLENSKERNLWGAHSAGRAHWCQSEESVKHSPTAVLVVSLLLQRSSDGGGERTRAMLSYIPTPKSPASTELFWYARMHAGPFNGIAGQLVGRSLGLLWSRL